MISESLIYDIVELSDTLLVNILLSKVTVKPNEKCTTSRVCIGLSVYFV